MAVGYDVGVKQRRVEMLPKSALWSGLKFGSTILAVSPSGWLAFCPVVIASVERTCLGLEEGIYFAAFLNEFTEDMQS